MLPILARSCDRLLSRWLAKRVARPNSELPRPQTVPETPDVLTWPDPIRPTAVNIKGDLWKFEAPSPIPSLYEETQTIHGRLLGPTNARRAVVILHGAYGEYVNCEMMARAFVKQGFRAVIPAAPYHLERTPQGVSSGNVFFWSTALVVSGVAQWLAETHGLIQWLREEGVEQVGLVGYSIGSLTAGMAGTLWSDLDFVIPLAPVGHHLEAIQQSPAASRFWPWMRDVSSTEAELFDRWAPRYRPMAAKQTLFLVTRYDELQPAHLQHEWRKSWNEAPYHEYGHGHISICFSRVLYRDLGTFAAELG